ncbi:MAG TPA: hypothetical protein VH234_03770 [Candidatus Saccharimonadales bacterium]|jgi:hypothetical protein|nr:hypothetical protein [Candidatus Saccharimonadales bacterium]
MKPPSVEYHVAVLDTQAELEVVRDYISSVTFLKTLPGFAESMRTGIAHAKDSENPIGGRFFYNVTAFNPATHKSEIKDGAEFGLDEVEAQVALSAGKWVLGRKSPLARIKNQRNGRTDAAQEIVNTLEGLGISQWQGLEQ